MALSENSLDSDWVRDEFEYTMTQEKHRNTTILLPICIDNLDSLLNSDKAWVQKLSQRLIGDFTGWKNPDKFMKAMEELLRALKV